MPVRKLFVCLFVILLFTACAPDTGGSDVTVEVEVPVDPVFEDHVNIRWGVDRVEVVDEETLAWGREVLDGLKLSGTDANADALKIFEFIHGNFIFNSGRPKTIADFCEVKDGNCYAHSRLAIFMLRLANIPAKFVYEVHLELKSASSARQARERGTGLFGHFHNDHFWVLYHNGERWVPMDTALGIVGYDGLARRWSGDGVADNPPFVVWEDSGNNEEGLLNVTKTLWDRMTLEPHNDLTPEEWREFTAHYEDVELELFQIPLPEEHIARIEAVARQFFKSMALPVADYPAAAEKYADELYHDGDVYRIFESEINGLGYQALGAGEHEAAIALFEVNVRLFPNSANAYDSLGEAYLAAGDEENARINYAKSLELNPNNNNAKEVLERLK